MNPRTKKLLSLKRKHGLTWAEIGSIINRHHGTVRQYAIGYRTIPVKSLNALVQFVEGE